MSINFELITLEYKGKIACITLNRPDKLNALNAQVLSELSSALEDIQAKPFSEVCGVIFTGAGEKAFIAGADIAAMATMTAEQAREFGELGQGVTLQFESLKVPVIACVNGFALGGGCEMAMACDFIYATENAIFGQPEVKLGLIPGFGGTQRLAKYIGRAAAKEIIYSGRNMKVDEALARGLVLQKFISKDEMIEAATTYLHKMSHNSPVAINIAKRAINEGVDDATSTGLKKELSCFAEVFNSEDMQEGTKAFLEKRNAQFPGR